MKERARRAIEACKLIATMSEESGRTTRRFLSPPMHDVHAYLRARMEAMGMEVRLDAAGNLRGIWTPATIGRAERLILGSHIDTVPDAGAYDGVLGVTMALEWVEIAEEMDLPLAIEVIAFSEEEGVRYGVPFIGSRAAAGRFDPALLALQDAEGIPLDEAIRSFGLEPAAINDAALETEGMAFVEIHIEQGPVLESEDLSVAAVTGIVGQTRLNVVFQGQANHAGTTPMHLRRDALAAAAEWIVAVETMARQRDGLVATVGKISAEPNAGNVIPGRVTVSLDVRHASDSRRNEAVHELTAIAEAIAGRRGLTVTYERVMNQPAVAMDERLTAFMTEAIEASGFPTKIMASGAGHDAMVMASRMPTAMLFLRSPGGISHHPAEAVREEDVEAAMHVGRHFMKRLAAENRH